MSRLATFGFSPVNETLPMTVAALASSTGGAVAAGGAFDLLFWARYRRRIRLG